MNVRLCAVAGQRVVGVLESWVVTDGWWREPAEWVRRTYHEVLLADGNTTVVVVREGDGAYRRVAQ